MCAIFNRQRLPETLPEIESSVGLEQLSQTFAPPTLLGVFKLILSHELDQRHMRRIPSTALGGWRAPPPDPDRCVREKEREREEEREEEIEVTASRVSASGWPRRKRPSVDRGTLFRIPDPGCASC